MSTFFDMLTSRDPTRSCHIWFVRDVITELVRRRKLVRFSPRISGASCRRVYEQKTSSSWKSYILANLGGSVQVCFSWYITYKWYIRLCSVNTQLPCFSVTKIMNKMPDPEITTTMFWVGDTYVSD